MARACAIAIVGLGLAAPWCALAQSPALVWTASTLAGSPTQAVGFADGVGSNAGFSFPAGLVITSRGTLYVAEATGPSTSYPFGNDVRAVNNVTGAVSTFVGLATRGPPSSGYANGAGTAAIFNEPYGIALSADGSSLYVGDTKNSVIRRVAVATGVVSLVAGLPGSGTNAVLTNGAGTNARFNYPAGVTVCTGSSSVLYVTDSRNHAIRQITGATFQTITIAGVGGSAGLADGTGTAATFNTPLALVQAPSPSWPGVAGVLYVADTFNCVIRAVTIANPSSVSALTPPIGTVTTFAGSRDAICAFADGFAGNDAYFNYPSGLALDPAGTMLYVADTNNNNVRSIVIASRLTFTLAGSVTYVAGQWDAPSQTALFNQPTSIAFVSPSLLYVTDALNNQIRVLQLQPCPAGYYCITPYAEVRLCPANAYCPAGSLAPIQCAAGTVTASVGATLASACFVAGASGSACSAGAQCASGVCLRGACCTPDAVRASCSACALGTGACALASPGDACTTSFDCGTNLCLGGCCCSAAVASSAGCSACTCWSNGATTAATAGTCSASGAYTPALACNASVSVPQSVPLSSVITFPSSANIREAVPLVFLSAVSPINKYNVNIIVASNSTCAAYAALNGGSLACNFNVPFLVSGQVYFFLGRASELGMEPAAQCSTS